MSSSRSASAPTAILPARRWRAWLRRMLVAIVFVATATWPLWSGALGVGQDRSGAGQDPAQDTRQLAAMLKKYEEAARPGKFHEVLKPLEGEFNAVAEFVSPDGPQTSTGYSRNAWMLGSRFMRQDFNGTLMGRQFHAVSYTGYNNPAGKYQSVWMDEMSSAMFISDGEVDASGKTITFTGEAMDPITSQIRAYRHVLRIVDNDHYTFEMFEPGLGGEMDRTVAINYTRATTPGGSTQPATRDSGDQRSGSPGGGA